MHLAIEYLARKKFGRRMVRSALFIVYRQSLAHHEIAVTINEEFKPSQFYCVKHWHLHKCKRNQAAPSFTEFRVPKTEVFTHQAVVMPGHRLMRYTPVQFLLAKIAALIQWLKKSTHYFYDNYFDTLNTEKQSELAMDRAHPNLPTSFMQSLPLYTVVQI